MKKHAFMLKSLGLAVLSSLAAGQAAASQHFWSGPWPTALTPTYLEAAQDGSGTVYGVNPYQAVFDQCGQESFTDRVIRSVDGGVSWGNIQTYTGNALLNPFSPAGCFPYAFYFIPTPEAEEPEEWIQGEPIAIGVNTWNVNQVMIGFHEENPDNKAGAVFRSEQGAMAYAPFGPDFRAFWHTYASPSAPIAPVEARIRGISRQGGSTWVATDKGLMLCRDNHLTANLPSSLTEPYSLNDYLHACFIGSIDFEFNNITVPGFSEFDPRLDFFKVITWGNCSPYNFSRQADCNMTETGRYNHNYHSVDGIPLLDVAADPNNPNVIYVAVEECDQMAGGLYKGTKPANRDWNRTESDPFTYYGATFERLSLGVLDVTEIQVTSDGYIYVAAASNIYRSNDGGQTWRTLSPLGGDSDFGDATVVSVAAGPGGLVTAGLNVGTVVESHDYGETWKAHGFLLSSDPDSKSISLSPTPGKESTLYLGSASARFKKSDNYGADWVDVNFLAGTPTAMTSIYKNGVSKTFVGIDQGIYYSDDEGLTWKQAGTWTGSRSFYQIKANPANQSILYATASDGFYISHDEGLTWAKSMRGLPGESLAVYSIDAELAKPSQLVIGISHENSVYISDDGGLNWRYGELSLRNTIQDIQISQGWVYVAVRGDNLHRAKNLFDPASPEYQQWYSIDLSHLSRHLVALSVDPNSPQVVYVAIKEGGAYRSVDGGDTWQDISLGYFNSEVNGIEPHKDGLLLFAASETESAGFYSFESEFEYAVFNPNDSTFRLIPEFYPIFHEYSRFGELTYTSQLHHQVTFGDPAFEQVGLLGRWNGKRAGLGVYNRTTGTFKLKNSVLVGGTPDYEFRYGPFPSSSNWVPVVGDWNGDGSDTIGLYDRMNSVFHLKDSNSGGFADLSFAYGAPGGHLLPIIGDWPGDDGKADGITDIGVYDPQTGAFFLKRLPTPENRSQGVGGIADIVFLFGPQNSTWQPISGPWGMNGNHSGIGLYDPDTQTFLFNASLTSAPAVRTIQLQLGVNGEIVVNGR